MRVALVAPLVSAIAQPYLGGAQALLADLAQGLLHRGHSVILFARNESFVPGIDIEAVLNNVRTKIERALSDAERLGTDRRIDLRVREHGKLLLERH